MDSDKEAPIESTFVRIKETPSEQESTVFFLAENGERAYTVNHETSHPPPSKVFVCDKPESVKEPSLDGISSRPLSVSSTEIRQQVTDQDLQGVPGKTCSFSEPSPESSILARKDNHRSNSLSIKKTVHFEADTYKDASCSKDPFHSQDFGFEGSLRGTKELLKQDGHVLEVTEEKPKQEAPKVQESAPRKAPGDVCLADSKLGHSQTPPWNGASERAASQGEENRPLSPLGEDTVMADSLEIKIKLQTVDALDKEDDFEGIPLKASKFNSDLVDFATTSQAFSEDPSAPEKKPAQGEGPEEHAEKPGKRRSKSAHKKEDSDGPPGAPGQEDKDYFLAPEEEPADKKPEVYEKAKCKSPRRGRGEDEAEAEAPGELGADLPPTPPSSRVSLETLGSGSHSEEGLDFKPSPPLSKVSVIPHDLFYYPHYEVPLAAVLEAYAEGTEDFKNEEMDFEEPEEFLYDLEPRDDDAEEPEEPEASESSGSFSGLGEDFPYSAMEEPAPDRAAQGAKPASEPAPPPARDPQPRDAADSASAESQQVPDRPPRGGLPSWGSAAAFREELPSQGPRAHGQGGAHSGARQGQAGTRE